MSTPAGLQQSKADLLARWMPSSSRAGVILNLSPQLIESMRNRSTWEPESRGPDPDDSFTSDFAPLSASTNSSCVGVDTQGESVCTRAEPGDLNPRCGAEGTMSDKPLNGLYSEPLQHSFGQLDTIEDFASKPHDLSLIMKLEQLRQWQQHMQDQLKAHQLEELLHLQEDQQRLLGLMNGYQHCGADYTENSGLSGTQWGENTLRGGSTLREAPQCHAMKGQGVPQGFPHCPQREPETPQVGRRGQLRRGGGSEEMEDQMDVSDAQSSRESDQEQSDEGSHYLEHNNGLPCNGAAATENLHREEERPLQDRPINPGLVGRKQTFEELLEEQLKVEQQKMEKQQQQNCNTQQLAKAPLKRAFLKRGQGLARFSNNHRAPAPHREAKQDFKLQPATRICSRSNSVSARPAVQCKTTVLNKENRASGPRFSLHQDGRGRPERGKVLGTRQRQNTEEDEPIEADTDGGQNQQHQQGKCREQNTRKCSRTTAATRSSPPRQQGLSGQTARSFGSSATQPTNAVIKAAGVAGAARITNTGRPNQLTASGRTGPEENEEEEEEEGGGGGGGAGDHVMLENSFDLSFQEKLRRWDCEGQREQVELGEFELLEQAAKELSFSSNSSFVMKVIEMDQQHRQLQAARGLHQRRLSSTPIKSPPKTHLMSISSGPGRTGSSDDMNSKSSSSDSDTVVSRYEAPRRVGDGDGIQWRGAQASAENEGEESDKQDSSDASLCSSSEFQEAALTPPVFPSSICFPPYDKRDYQDWDGETASDGDDATLMEDQRGGLAFDDEDPWNDQEEPSDALPRDAREPTLRLKATAAPSSPCDRALTCKVLVARGAAPGKGAALGSANEEPPDSPPPASQLMIKLFPTLKPKSQNAPVAVPEPRKPEEATARQVQSDKVRQRLAELESEIERFKTENAALSRLKEENQRNQENLRRERDEFERWKAEELSRVEELRKEGKTKLQKERRVFEKHCAAVRAAPDKKEREEIQALKQQISSVQEELSRKESRWSSTLSRLREQMESLRTENEALKEEVNTLERLRLSAWGWSSTQGQRREGGRLSDCSSTSTTKGVKFASPLDTRGGSPPPGSSSWTTRKNSLPAPGSMKSSLRRPSVPAPSSSSSSRPSEEKPVAAVGTPVPEPSNSLSVVEVGSRELETQPEVTSHTDGKTEQLLPGGGRLVVFPNGTKKEVSADGLTAKVTFFNGDTKEVMADERVVYYYAEARTTHTSFPDGTEILQFPNNQTEKHFPDGRKEVTFPDQMVKTLHPDGREESVLTDGTVIHVAPDGTKRILFNTGQKETHAADYKRREYPDGTVKTVYSDGRQETHYACGRVRLKDKDGNVVLDNKL